MGKKKNKNEKSAAEIALLVENVMAELEVVAEEDAELNRQGKPAITKLRKLSLITDVLSKGTKSGQSSSRQHASRPEAMLMDFVVRPKSKVDPDEVRARAKHMVQDQRRVKMNKKLQQLKAPKQKQLQARKLSVEGRGMVKYL